LEDGGFFTGTVKDEYKVKKGRTSRDYDYSGNSDDPFDNFYDDNDDDYEEDNVCLDNCSNLWFECGTQTICGLGKDCGNCSNFGLDFVCSGSKCVEQNTCADNCSVFEYECGNHTICGQETNCGTCGIGFSCNSSSMCEEDYVCEDTCGTFNYECGNFTICDGLVNCGGCSSYGSTFVCNATGLCIDGYTCEDTCQTYNYECDSHTICGIEENCGTCGSGYSCNVSGMCEEDCTDTCVSLNFECGNQLVCGIGEDCGTCSDANVCTSDTCNAGTCAFNALCGLDGVCCASEGCSSDPDCAQSWETGMVSWWDFNGDANDGKGSNHGTVYGATQTSTGCKSGGCYDFDGNSDYIDVGTFSVSGSAITISAWANYEASTFGLDPRIISKAHGTATNDHVFLLGLDDTSSSSAEYRFRFTAGGSTLSHNEDTVSSPTGWKHIVGVYDGSNSKIYVNGVLKGSTSKTGSLLTNSDGVTIGKNPVTTELGWRYWDGKLDEIMIWNRALNSTEVNDLYGAF